MRLSLGNWSILHADLHTNQYEFILTHRNLDNLYKEFSIPKRNGKLRTISSPNDNLKQIQSRLSCILQDIYKPSPTANAYIKGRGIFLNAFPHLTPKIVIKIDLKDFFPSISFYVIRNLFCSKPFKFNNFVSTFLARICCHKGALPQGAPSSPVLSNMICDKLDEQLSNLALKSCCNYTRYADDMTISSHAKYFPKSIILSEDPFILSNNIKEIIEYNNNFKINIEKTKIWKTPKPIYVTDIKVNTKTNLSRNKYRQIRAMIHAYYKYGNDRCLLRCKEICHRTPKCDFYSLIKSKISYFEMARGGADNVSKKLRDKLDRVHHKFNNSIIKILKKMNFTYDFALGKEYFFINVYDLNDQAVGKIWQRRSDFYSDVFFTNIPNLVVTNLKYIH